MTDAGAHHDGQGHEERHDDDRATACPHSCRKFPGFLGRPRELQRSSLSEIWPIVRASLTRDGTRDPRHP